MVQMGKEGPRNEGVKPNSVCRSGTAHVSQAAPSESGPKKADQQKEERERKARERQLYSYRVNMDGLEMLEVGTELLRSRDFIFISLDLEMWELDSNKITEVGISVLNMTEQKEQWMPRIDVFHIVPNEARSHFNGRRIADKRGLFAHGKTMTMSMAECKQFWGDLVDALVARSPNVYFVGQSVKDDLACLNKNGFSYNTTLPVLDTQLIWCATSSLPYGLIKMLQHLEIPHAFLHNAGNDAYLTMQVLVAILDPSIRLKYGLDIGPNAAEAARILHEHRKPKSAGPKDPDEFAIALSPEEEARRKEQEKIEKMTPAEKKRHIFKLRAERIRRRLAETKEDMPSKMVAKSATEALAEYLEKVKIE